MLINKIKKVIALHWLTMYANYICLLILTLSSLKIRPWNPGKLEDPRQGWGGAGC